MDLSGEGIDSDDLLCNGGAHLPQAPCGPEIVDASSWLNQV